MVEYLLESRRGGSPLKVDNEVEEEMDVIFEVVKEVLMAVTHGGPSFGGCEGPPFAGPCCQAGRLELAEKVGSFCRCTQPHCLHSIAP